MKFFVFAEFHHFLSFANMLLKISILTYITQLPQADNEVLRIEEEGSFETNPVFTEDKSLRDTIERFATSEQWQQAQDNDDPRFRLFAESPGTPRPAWLQDFMDYARKRCSHYKKTVSEGGLVLRCVEGAAIDTSTPESLCRV
jgi:hypothetical protein